MNEASLNQIAAADPNRSTWLTANAGSGKTRVLTDRVARLLLAALMGVLIPMTLMRLGRDPAMGASVMITAMTDSGGFFIFLGLATLFLL